MTKRNEPHFYQCVTDCFLTNEKDEMLLIHRKKDRKVLPNFYNGVGGKMERFETSLESVQREILEETGSNEAKNIALKGMLSVEDKFGPWQIFLFTGKMRKQEVQNAAISEGNLEWIPRKYIKKKKLVPDLYAWIDLLWSKQKFFFAKAAYDDAYNLTDDVSVKIIH